MDCPTMPGDESTVERLARLIPCFDDSSPAVNTSIVGLLNTCKHEAHVLGECVMYAIAHLFDAAGLAAKFQPNDEGLTQYNHRAPSHTNSKFDSTRNVTSLKTAVRFVDGLLMNRTDEDPAIQSACLRSLVADHVKRASFIRC
jgi:hypothetical protein